jgi:peptidoglycan-associated lipoprotein
MKWTRLTIAACLVALLSACGSNVRLDESQISDGKGTQVNKQPDANASQSQQGIQKVTVGDDASQIALPKDLALLVYFDFDSYVVKPEFQSVVAAHARYLSRNKAVKLSIEGHTDERGGREYNIALGQRRAEAVRKSLSLLGVPESQMEAVSFGKEKPAEAGSSEESMAKNRRAFFNYR